MINIYTDLNPSSSIRQGLIAAAVGLCLLTSTPAWSEDQPQKIGRGLDAIVAVVDNDVILTSEFERSLQETRQSLSRQASGHLPPEAMLKERVLEQLIIDSVQLQRALASGIRIADEKVEQAIAMMAQQNNLSVSDFRQAISQQGVSYAMFREEMRKNLLINEFRQRVVNDRIDVSAEEIDNFLALKENTSEPEFRFWHVSIPSTLGIHKQRLEAQLASLKTPDDFTALEVATQNQLEGKVLDWRKGSELPTFLEDSILNLTPGHFSTLIEGPGGWHLVHLIDKRDEGAEFVQETLARHILIKPTTILSEDDAERKLKALRERIIAGEAFSELAKAYSDDPISAHNGGELGWSRPGMFVPAFEETMNKLKVNELSQVFKSRFGWHIIEILKRQEKNITEENLRAEARKAIHQRKFNDELENWLMEIRQQAYVDIKTLT